MFSFKAIIENAVVQGRRVILQSTRARAERIQEKGKSFLIENSNKLSERGLQSGAGRTGVHCQKSAGASGGSIPSIAIHNSVGGSIANFLRPVTARFLQGLLHRVSNPLWVETRRRTIKRLFGDTAPFFALVGVTLVAGPDRGFLTAQDELEALCGDIREAISRAGWLHNPDFWKFHEKKDEQLVDSNEPITLGDFELGSAIDKGCNAVVYAARWAKDPLRDESQGTSLPTREDGIKEDLCDLSVVSNSLWSLNHIQLLQSNNRLQENDPSTNSEENMSMIFSEAVTENCCDATGIDIHESTPIRAEATYMTNQRSNLSLIDHASISGFKYLDGIPLAPVSRSRRPSLSEDVDLLLSTGGFKKVKKKKVKFKGLLSSQHSGSDGSFGRSRIKSRECLIEDKAKSCIEEYPLAIKMMFNYEAESNAPAILTAMYKELLPARTLQLDQDTSLWKERFLSNSCHLPPHQNVVEMPCVFVDRVELLEGGFDLYPEALPKRLNPGGFGRNMSLFCVMKRYDCSLAEYLSRYEPSTRTSLLLLAQLLEGILHLNKYNVAHRDLKADNLLVSTSNGWDEPRLVITDFGCCLCDPSSKMKASFPSYEADPRLGNAALMAPEIKTAVPGLLKSINFSCSDLWAVGALAFEIFGLENPFFRKSATRASNHPFFDSGTYREAQLSKLPKRIPLSIRRLVYNLLRRNPRQRPSPVVAATICQLALWGPSKWLNRHALTMPSHSEVTKWLLCLSTKVLCEAGVAAPSQPSSSSDPLQSVDASAMPRNSQQGAQLEYEIVSTFLSRIHYDDIVQAIRWLRVF